MTVMLRRAAVDGVDLEYELRGTGEPVVLIHWGVGVVWAGPLLDQPALADHYQLLSYHRAGFAGSSRLAGSVTMATHAAHCRLLMRESKSPMQAGFGFGLHATAVDQEPIAA